MIEASKRIYTYYEATRHNMSDKAYRKLSRAFRRYIPDKDLEEGFEDAQNYGLLPNHRFAYFSWLFQGFAIVAIEALYASP